MHELWIDCNKALSDLDEGEIPSWISDVVELPIVNGEFASEHNYHESRPAA